MDMNLVKYNDSDIKIDEIEGLFDSWNERNPELKVYSDNALNYIKAKFPDVKNRAQFDLDNLAIEAIGYIVPYDDIQSEVYEGLGDSIEEYARSIVEQIKNFILEICDDRLIGVEISAKALFHMIGDDILEKLNIPRPYSTIYLILAIEMGYRTGKASLCEAMEIYR